MLNNDWHRTDAPPHPDEEDGSEELAQHWIKFIESKKQRGETSEDTIRRLDKEELEEDIRRWEEENKGVLE